MAKLSALKPPTFYVHEVVMFDDRNIGGAKGALDGGLIDLGQAPGKEVSAAMLKLETIREIDPRLCVLITSNILTELCVRQVPEAVSLYSEMHRPALTSVDDNQPISKGANYVLPYERVLDIARSNFSPAELDRRISESIVHHRSSDFVTVVSEGSVPLASIRSAIYDYHAQGSPELSPEGQRTVNSALISQFLSPDVAAINALEPCTDLPYFMRLMDQMIGGPNSTGMIGGKAAGAQGAWCISSSIGLEIGSFGPIRLPRSLFITADNFTEHMRHNNLGYLVGNKYRSIDEVAQVYPGIIEHYKNSPFPPEIVQALSAKLDGLGDGPLVVRSSSLLEDRHGSAFSGKYKSLFLANQGSHDERLAAVLDAIAEVYASVYGPDAIDYRNKRGLLNFNEKMGVILQEVVGTRIGDYFMPAFAGVAFSRNEFSWSPRIAKEDGLLRMVPGLGTRAVDSVSGDYPILIAPGRPEIRTVATAEDVARFSPQKIDVFDLKIGKLVTKDLAPFLDEVGVNYPIRERLISKVADGQISPLGKFDSFNARDLVVDFRGLLESTKFAKSMKVLLSTLEEKLGYPVDIEFASDGPNFYLLQCRPHNSPRQRRPAEIPIRPKLENVLFTADRFAQSGLLDDIRYLVYIDPEGYKKIQKEEDYKSVAAAVGALNRALPEKGYVLLGPGRIGSRDQLAGPPIPFHGYSNTAMLVEISCPSLGFKSDLSHGNHASNDHIETEIFYLPLYPESRGVEFKWDFFKNSENSLTALAPGFEHVSAIVRVIDLQQTTRGQTLKIYMNGERAMAVLEPTATPINLN